MAYGSDIPDDLAPFLDKAAAKSGLDRSRFIAELAANPALREKIMAISAGENLDPRSNQAVLESMMNRADMMGTPLAQEARTTGERGYYAGYNPRALNNPNTRAMIEGNLQSVLGGSNVSNYATDNASEGNSHFASRRFASGQYTPNLPGPLNGEYYSHPSNATARGFRQYDPWVARVSGPSNEAPQSPDDQFASAVMNGQAKPPQQAPQPPIPNVAVASAPQAAQPNVASASQPADGTQSQGFFGSIASAAGAPNAGKLLDDNLGGGNSSGGSISLASQETQDDKDAAKALQAAMQTTQQAAGNPQMMPFKPIDMQRVAAVIQRLQGQGPMGTGTGALGADQQPASGYFGTIG